MSFRALIAIMVIAAVCVLVLAVRDDEKQDQQWLEFTAQHHCKVSSESSWAPTLWQCDGFQVRHR
jgi:hypothetical protein